MTSKEEKKHPIRPIRKPEMYVCMCVCEKYTRKGRGEKRVQSLASRVVRGRCGGEEGDWKGQGTRWADIPLRSGTRFD